MTAHSPLSVTPRAASLRFARHTRGVRSRLRQQHIAPHATQHYHVLSRAARRHTTRSLRLPRGAGASLAGRIKTASERDRGAAVWGALSHTRSNHSAQHPAPSARQPALAGPPGSRTLWFVLATDRRSAAGTRARPVKDLTSSVPVRQRIPWVAGRGHPAGLPPGQTASGRVLADSRACSRLAHRTCSPRQHTPYRTMGQAAKEHEVVR